MKLLALIATSVISTTAFAGPATPPAPVAAKPPFPLNVLETIEHLPRIFWNDVTNWWKNGGNQETEMIVQDEIAGIGTAMVENLVNGGKFDAGADAASGAIEGLRTLEGTNQPLSPTDVTQVVSEQIPDDPQLATTVSVAANQALQTVTTTGKLSKDQALEAVANGLQQQVTAAKAASVP